jgi:hypothetical protein
MHLTHLETSYLLLGLTSFLFMFCLSNFVTLFLFGNFVIWSELFILPAIPLGIIYFLRIIK